MNSCKKFLGISFGFFFFIQVLRVCNPNSGEMFVYLYIGVLLVYGKTLFKNTLQTNMAKQVQTSLDAP